MYRRADGNDWRGHELRSRAPAALLQIVTFLQKLLLTTYVTSYTTVRFLSACSDVVYFLLELRVISQISFGRCDWKIVCLRSHGVGARRWSVVRGWSARVNTFGKQTHLFASFSPFNSNLQSPQLRPSSRSLIRKYIVHPFLRPQ